MSPRLADHFRYCGHERRFGAVGAWLAAGQIQYVEEIIEGPEAAPQAFIRPLRGENLGKRVVRVGPLQVIENKENRT